MSVLEKIFKPKTEVPPRGRTQEEREASSRAESQRAREKAAEEDRQRIEEAKQKFVTEKPKLERRLTEIPGEIENYQRGLEELKGPEMRQILDKEFKINSSLSPIDSTDSSRAREYERWVQARKDSQRAVQSQKADLGRRIDNYQKQINELGREKTEIERRIQRGY